MSQAVLNAAMQACATLDGVIESLFEDEDLASNGAATEIRAELCEAYSGLADVLTAEVGVDVRQLVRDVAAADIEAWRAILRARGLM